MAKLCMECKSEVFLALQVLTFNGHSTKFADLTQEEFSSHFLGSKRGSTEYAKNVLQNVPAAGSDSVDWTGVYTVWTTRLLAVYCKSLFMFTYIKNN